MFGLFKKKTAPEKLIDSLGPHYTQVVSLVNAMNGPFVNHYEAGIFVAAVATSKILTFQKVDPPSFANEFNNLWVNYLVGSCSVDGARPSKDDVWTRLQEKFPIYREIFCDTIDQNLKEKASVTRLCLMSELYRNCTGKQKQEGGGKFLHLTDASVQLVAIGLSIIKEVHE